MDHVGRFLGEFTASGKSRRLLAFSLGDYCLSMVKKINHRKKRRGVKCLKLVESVFKTLKEIKESIEILAREIARQGKRGE